MATGVNSSHLTIGSGHSLGTLPRCGAGCGGPSAGDGGSASLRGRDEALLVKEWIASLRSQRRRCGIIFPASLRGARRRSNPELVRWLNNGLLRPARNDGGVESSSPSLRGARRRSNPELVRRLNNGLLRSARNDGGVESSFPVIARSAATKQSRACALVKNGLLRSARNDGGVESSSRIIARSAATKQSSLS